MSISTIAKSRFAPFFVLIVGILLFFLIYDNKNKQIAAFEEYRFESTKESYEAALLAHKEITDIIFRVVVDQKDILATFAKAYSNPDNNDSIRAELQKKLLPAYNLLKTSGLKQLHFQTTTGNSFLRMHKPESFGDPLADIRASIKIANFDKKYVSGFEEGRIYNGFRYVHPLFYEGKHIGSVETSISAREMLLYLRSINEGMYQLYLDKNVSKVTVWKQNLEKFYKGTILSDDFLVETSASNSDLIDKVNIQVQNETKKRLTKYKPFIVGATVDGKNYIAVFMPITSISGNKSAYLARYIEDDTLWLINRDFKYKTVILLVTLVVLMFIVSLLRKEILQRQSAQDELKKLNNSLEYEVKKQVEELKKKDEVLFLQSKHAAMGEMIGAIAHQWRQPLNILGLAIQDVKLSYQFGELDESYIDTFSAQSMEQIQHMSDTIEDFRSFFNTDEELEIVNIAQVILDAYTLVQKQFEIHNVVVDISGEGFSSLGRSGDFKQVILNLLNNAKDQIYIMRKAGKEVDSNIKITMNIINNMGHIVVEDCAGGIKEEDIPKLFDSYFTTKNSDGGTGIGLYMSKLIITSVFKGGIRVSNGKRGAIFEIVLPLATP